MSLLPRHRLLPLLLVAAALAPADGAARPRRRPLLTVPVRILVARCAAAPASRPGAAPPETGPALPETGPAPASQPVAVRSRRWVEAHLRAAAEVFGPHGVALQAEVGEFTPARCDVVGRAARDELARHVPRDRRVTVLVVRRLPDLAVPSYDLSGVHWRSGRGDPALAGRAYVILTARARPPVLAHELCHYFGLPHYRRGGNLMTPGPSDPAWRRRTRRPRAFAPRLLPSQVRRLRAGVAAFLQGGRAAPPPRPVRQRR